MLGTQALAATALQENTDNVDPGWSCPYWSHWEKVGGAGQTHRKISVNIFS